MGYPRLHTDMCQAPGCPNKHHQTARTSHRYCVAHYFRLRRYGSFDLPPPAEKPPCACGRAPACKGMCRSCYSKSRYKQERHPPQRPLVKDRMATCHPGRPAKHSDGRCHACYCLSSDRARRARERDQREQRALLT